MTTTNTYKYKLGLALSGGGAKGIAHLGILKVLDEKGVRPSIIAGTSSGALAGALYADGNSPDEIACFFKKKVFKEFAALAIPNTGLFNTDPFHKFLKKHLKARTFEELKTPLKIVATDIANGKSVIFDKGPLIPAIIASCAYPIVFKPVEIDKIHYVDGGLFKNLPVTPIRFDCETVIGVNVSPLTKVEYKNSMLYIAERSFHYISVSNSMVDRKLCDILIETDRLSSFATFTLDHTQEIFDIGYEVASKELGKDEYKALFQSLRNKTAEEEEEEEEDQNSPTAS